jgi:hypothetical protein
MFPIIILLIEAGRIFAFVGGPAAKGLPGVGFVMAFFIVLIGFFGPLFLLPKTFRWGGSLMQTVGQNAFKFSGSFSERPKKYFQNRQQDWSEQRRRRSTYRVATGEGFSKNPLSWYRTPLDRIRSGKMDPLKQVPGYRDVGRRSVEEYVRAGEEIYQKDIEAARAKVLREGQAIRARGGNWDLYFQQIADGAESYKDEKLGKVEIGKRSDLERTAARKQLATLGAQTNWRYLESYYQQSIDPSSNMSDQERVDARKFFDDNVQLVMPKLPHVYTGAAAAADSNPTTIGSMHGVGVEAILSNLSRTINDTSRRPSDRSNAQSALLTFLKNFQEAASNPNITVENGSLRAVKAFLDSDQGAGFRQQINYDSDNPNNPGRDGRVPRNIPSLPVADSLRVTPEVRAQIDTLKSVLAPAIDPQTGTYTPTIAPTATGEVRVEHEDRPQQGTQPPPNTGRFNPPGDSSSTGGF